MRNNDVQRINKLLKADDDLVDDLQAILEERSKSIQYPHDIDSNYRTRDLYGHLFDDENNISTREGTDKKRKSQIDGILQKRQINYSSFFKQDKVGGHRGHVPEITVCEAPYILKTQVQQGQFD